MCRGFFIGGLIAMLVLVAAPAMAQTPRLQLRVTTPPPIVMMPPARAGQLALQQHPGATLLKIIPLPGKGFNVTIKQGSTITRKFIPNQ